MSCFLNENLDFISKVICIYYTDTMISPCESEREVDTSTPMFFAENELRNLIRDQFRYDKAIRQRRLLSKLQL